MLRLQAGPLAHVVAPLLCHGNDQTCCSDPNAATVLPVCSFLPCFAVLQQSCSARADCVAFTHDGLCGYMKTATGPTQKGVERYSVYIKETAGGGGVTTPPTGTSPPSRSAYKSSSGQAADSVVDVGRAWFVFFKEALDWNSAEASCCCCCRILRCSLHYMVT